MRKILISGFVTFVFAACAVSASAATMYTTTLSGLNEVPPTTSPGTGTVDMTLNGTMLSVSITFANLTSPDTAAHIHCCAPLGTDAGVALPFTTFPLGVTSGTFTDTYDLTMATVYEPTFLTANGGTAVGAEAALVAGLNDFMAYVNIHTTQNPNGEIRGQVATTVPEPSTLLLGATMLAGIIALRRNK